MTVCKYLSLQTNFFVTQKTMNTHSSLPSNGTPIYIGATKQQQRDHAMSVVPITKMPQRIPKTLPYFTFVNDYWSPTTLNTIYEIQSISSFCPMAVCNAFFKIRTYCLSTLTSTRVLDAIAVLRINQSFLWIEPFNRFITEPRRRLPCHRHSWLLQRSTKTLNL